MVVAINYFVYKNVYNIPDSYLGINLYTSTKYFTIRLISRIKQLKRVRINAWQGILE